MQEGNTLTAEISSTLLKKSGVRLIILVTRARVFDSNRVSLSGQTETVSVRFRPVSVFSLVSVFRPKYDFRLKQAVLAESANFGRISQFWPHISV